MQTKLTLRLDADLIKSAKAHAKERGKSLSQIVADYFYGLNALKRSKHNGTPSRINDDELYPITNSLIGAWKVENVEKEYDYRKEYRHYLEEKYG